MTIRPAVASDVPAVADLEKSLFGVDAWSEATVLAELDGAGRHAVVAVEDGDLLGYAVTVYSADLVDLQRIGVRPDRQRQGVARALLDEVLADARSRGANRMLLEVSVVNQAALAFYASAGFVEIDRRRRYYRDGSDAVVMRRSVGVAACGGRGLRT